MQARQATAVSCLMMDSLMACFFASSHLVANAVVNSDALSLLYRPAEATHVYSTRLADILCN